MERTLLHPIEWRWKATTGDGETKTPIDDDIKDISPNYDEIRIAKQ